MRREHELQRIEQAFKTSPVVAILGPRQCGKTTLARHYFRQKQGQPSHYFDLEDPADQLRLSDPKLSLQDQRGLIVIDEIQRVPDLFPVLRVLVDQHQGQRYLILGSASRELIKQSSESLAGRIHYLELHPFGFQEVNDLQTLWLRGGFPLSYLAENEQGSMIWRKNYIRTFLEQDIPNLGINIPPERLRRFWLMLAHYHGGLFNASEIGNAMDVSHNTVQRYLDILSGTFMVRVLAPWYENLGKRQVKTKKIYFRDSGILHTLLNITNRDALLMHPKIGASWEGFALEMVLRHHDVDVYDAYFWAMHGSAELDLLIVQGTDRMGFEFKYASAPKLTRSMQTAMDALRLPKLTVIYPGEHEIRLTENITCIGLSAYLQKKT